MYDLKLRPKHSVPFQVIGPPGATTYAMSNDSGAGSGSSGSDSSASLWVRSINERIVDESLSDADIQSKGDMVDDSKIPVSGDAPRYRQPHGVGAGDTCEPCLFFFSPRGCSKGEACRYCHQHNFDPPTGRPTKAVREKIKARVYPLLQALHALDQSASDSASQCKGERHG